MGTHRQSIVVVVIDKRDRNHEDRLQQQRDGRSDGKCRHLKQLLITKRALKRTNGIEDE